MRDSGNERGRLGFADAAARAFALLLRRGFVLARREGTRLRFESRYVFVNVYHGRSSYEVGLEIGRTHYGDLYSLHEVLSAVAPESIALARCQTSERETLERCLVAIADSVERNCQGLLAGDDKAFEQLMSKVAPMRESATLKAQFGAIIERADRAWESKDLTEAADLYERAERALDETRQRRLGYLRSRAERS
ncbi:MAG: hypothetical protein KGR26_11565 [Cyanobacteria bacterium REEB65]|nr:hypothetical protein [Cyanobacteria bacterium REEB65]